MNWTAALKRDLVNVRNGIQEAGEDYSQVQNSIDIISEHMSAEEVANLLLQSNLGFFAQQVLNGNYTRIAEAENGPNAQAEDKETDDKAS
jgi:hypothetical protein